MCWLWIERKAVAARLPLGKGQDLNRPFGGGGEDDELLLLMLLFSFSFSFPFIIVVVIVVVLGVVLSP